MNDVIRRPCAVKAKSGESGNTFSRGDTVKASVSWHSRFSPFFARRIHNIFRQRWAALSLLLPLVAALGGCGYSFPALKDDGKPRIIYMADWENRTQKLALDSQIYQNLARWFRKSAAFRLTKNREGADYVLAGEILSIDLPSVSWSSRALATDVKLSLNTRYVVKDLKSGKIVWEVPGKTYTSDFAADMEVNSFSESNALREIVGDLAEDLYVGLLHRIRREEQDALREAALAQEKEAKADKEAEEDQGEEKAAQGQEADGTAEAPDGVEATEDESRTGSEPPGPDAPIP